MTTVRVIDPLPISTGTSAAVEEVTQAFDRFEQRSEDLTGDFEQTVAQLLAAVSDDIPIGIPELNFNVELPAVPAIPPVGSSTLPNDLDIDAPTAPDMTPQLGPQPTMSWPAAPTITEPNIPAAPVFDPLAVPTKPAVSTDLTVPDAPQLVLPAVPDLAVIDIPTFTPPVLPTFSETAPVFTAVAPNTAIEWAEPVYASENFDEALAVISRMRLGGTGLPAAVEQGLFERGRAREDRAAAKAVAELTDQWAARGFVAPPGALSAQRAAVLELAALNITTLSRDVLIKATDIEVENLRFSVTNGLAAEQILVNLHNNATQRLFEVAKSAVENALALYNSQVNVLNALNQGYATKAQVFRIRVDAELASLESQKLELEAARLRGDLNMQQVALYKERLAAVLSEIEVFKAQLAGVQARAEIVKTVYEGFRTEVQAFGEVIASRKVEADIHRSQVEGEVSRIKIGEARASIFTSLVGAEKTKVDAWQSASQVEIARTQAIGSNYGQTVKAFEAQVSRANAKVQAVLELIGRRLQAESVRNTALTEQNRAQLSIGEQKLQSVVAQANASIKLLEVTLTKLFQQMDLRARTLTAVGQMQATMAGGAMAAQHVSASIGATSGDTTSVNRSESLTNSLSESA